MALKKKKKTYLWGSRSCSCVGLYACSGKKWEGPILSARANLEGLHKQEVNAKGVVTEFLSEHWQHASTQKESKHHETLVAGIEGNLQLLADH